MKNSNTVNVIGIDVGGSTTKIVGFRSTESKKELIAPMFVRAADAVTSIYGAFGKFTLENDISLDSIDRVLMTGVGSSFIDKPLYGLNCVKASEFKSVGLGGLYLSGLDEAIVVSMGTGTALMHAVRRGDHVRTEYLGGTGIGGGTLLGLSRRMIGVDTIEHIEQLCEGGDLGNIDLRIRDISADQSFQINGALTASNFGKLSDMADNHDVALGIANMVAETIAMLSVFAARNFGIRDIVLTGNLTALSPIVQVFKGVEAHFGVNFIIPEHAQFATVIGAALCDSDL